MLKVKKNTYGSVTKSNEITKLTVEIKQSIQKLEEQKNKTIKDYAKLIQSIKNKY